MHFTCHTKINDDMEFQCYKKILKILVDKMTGLYNYMSFATQWVKRHGLSNSIVTSCKCLF